MSAELLVISLDGLGRPGLAALAQFCPVLKRITETEATVPLRGSGKAEMLWSEILTGAPWYQNGCPGFARPLDSLNRCEILNEARLHSDMNLLPMGAGGRQNISVNVPLVNSKSDRLWLSDGIADAPRWMAPKEHLTGEPFTRYKPRPFQCTVEAMMDSVAAIKAAIDVELVRLECAINLCARPNAKVALVRFTIFDLLSYLIDWDFHSLQWHRSWPDVAEFLAAFDRHLDQLLQLCDYFVVLSVYSHLPCRAAVNLNAALEQAGFASLLTPAELNAQTDIRLRLQARAAIDPTAQHQTPLFLRFHGQKTVIASPIYGQLYLNTKDRFTDGIVAQTDRDSILKEVTDALNSTLAVAELPLEIEAVPASPQSPDLHITMRGVDLSSYGRACIDLKNKPRSVTCPEGFVILPGAKFNEQGLGPTQLNSKLVEAIN